MSPILTNVAGFITLFSTINSCAGLIWDFTIKQYPTPFGSAPFLGSQLISTHQAVIPSCSAPDYFRASASDIGGPS